MQFSHNGCEGDIEGLYRPDSYCANETMLRS